MTVLNSIRYLIALDLKSKGLDASFITPTLNILKLIDDELVSVGYDFIDPRIEGEISNLEDAIMGLEKTITPHAYNLKNQGVIYTEQLNNFGNIIDLGEGPEDLDKLRWLDDEPL